MNRQTMIRRLLCALLILCLTLPLASCGNQRQSDGTAPRIGDLTYEDTVPLEYADQFAIYRYKGGYSLIDMVESDRILVVPEGASVPEGLDRDIVVVQQPLSHIYMAATSAMALFEGVDALDAISFVGSKSWYTQGAAAALENGDFV